MDLSHALFHSRGVKKGKKEKEKTKEKKMSQEEKHIFDGYHSFFYVTKHLRPGSL